MYSGGLGESVLRSPIILKSVWLWDEKQDEMGWIESCQRCLFSLNSVYWWMPGAGLSSAGAVLLGDGKGGRGVCVFSQKSTFSTIDHTLPASMASTHTLRVFFFHPLTQFPVHKVAIQYHQQGSFNEHLSLVWHTISVSSVYERKKKLLTSIDLLLNHFFFLPFLNIYFSIGTFIKDPIIDCKLSGASYPNALILNYIVALLSAFLL